MKEALLQIEEPADYFVGIGKSRLPTPTDILLFIRRSKDMLQQEALQNRSHHRFVLALNLETAGHVHINNLALPFNPGQVLLILPYQFHHFSQLASTQLKWLFCTFELEPRTFLEPLRNRVIDPTDKSRKIYEELLSIWHQPQSELQSEQLQTVLLRLLLSLKQDRQQTASDLPKEPEDNLLRAVNRLMSERSGRTVIVADLAQALGYSESRLRVLFKDLAGISLGSYMQNYRINRAMALLRTTTLTIADVAEEAGFGSPQAFSRIFKKETGSTPRAYRKL
ncbi:helix-turn-helix transcriptional regulator [Pontiellaceae bacterium B12227]|nr:helix-turn-helix transcriptional regulator [Pontiellaceae bacterium B12227]